MMTTWVLLANGSYAKIIQIDKKDNKIIVFKEFDHPKTALKGHEINTDKQGRSFQSFGSARSAMDPNEQQTDHERRVFAKEIADYLGLAHINHNFKNLILVVSPNLLGHLRSALPSTVLKAVPHQLDKDLLSQNLSDTELIEKIKQDLNLIRL